MLQEKKRDKKESIDDNLALIDTWKVGKNKGVHECNQSKKGKINF